MARKQTKPTESEPRRSMLLVPRAEAKAQIAERVKLGEELRQTDIRTPADLKAAREAYSRWSAYNEELMRRIVDADDLVRDYIGFHAAVLGGRELSFPNQVDEFRNGVDYKLNRLRSIEGRLNLTQESPSVLTVAEAQPIVRELGNRIFLVHGHDEQAKLEVERTIRQFEFEPIILRDTPNRGRTIIEKLEDFRDVGFAVVLLTPDDLGCERAEISTLHISMLKPRARQNVILELGFFVGVLGRSSVLALYKGDVEIPSDYSGVVWVRMDDHGAWKIALARDMKAAGFAVDLNRLV